MPRDAFLNRKACACKQTNMVLNLQAGRRELGRELVGTLS